MCEVALPFVCSIHAACTVAGLADLPEHVTPGPVACHEGAALAHGEACALGCDAGYSMRGTQPSCADGHFFPGSVTCGPDWCNTNTLPPQAVPLHGKLQGRCVQPSAAVAHSASCTLACRDGFRLDGRAPACDLGVWNAGTAGCSLESALPWLLSAGMVEDADFAAADGNGDGQVTPAELRLLFGARNATLDDAIARAVVAAADSDGDGVLEMAEFLGAIAPEGGGAGSAAAEGLGWVGGVLAFAGVAGACLVAAALLSLCGRHPAASKKLMQRLPLPAWWTGEVAEVAPATCDMGEVQAAPQEAAAAGANTVSGPGSCMAGLQELGHTRMTRGASAEAGPADNLAAVSSAQPPLASDGCELLSTAATEASTAAMPAMCMRSGTQLVVVVPPGASPGRRLRLQGRQGYAVVPEGLSAGQCFRIMAQQPGRGVW